MPYPSNPGSPIRWTLPCSTSYQYWTHCDSRRTFEVFSAGTCTRIDSGSFADLWFSSSTHQLPHFCPPLLSPLQPSFIPLCVYSLLISFQSINKSNCTLLRNVGLIGITTHDPKMSSVFSLCNRPALSLTDTTIDITPVRLNGFNVECSVLRD
jgi:hypothetical protein